MTSVHLKFAVFIFSLTCWAVTSHAALMTYTDRATWQAATSGTVTTIDFETPDASAAATGGAGFINTTPLYSTSQGVDFSISAQNVTDGGLLFLISPDLVPALPSQILSSEQNSNNVQNMTVSLPTLSGAIGLDLGSINETATITFALSNGETANSTIGPSPPFSFFGLVTDTAFSGIEISAPLSAADSIQIDNFAFAQAAIPLPATLALLGLGLAGIGYQRQTQIKAA